MEQMKHFVDTGTTVRVSVTDGRVFTGTLGCVDKQLNVVLINATETFKKKKERGGEKEKRENEEKEEENNKSDDDVETSSSSSPRVINMALIAREHRVKMERLEVEREEKEKEKEEANTESLLESALDKGLRIL